MGLTNGEQTRSAPFGLLALDKCSHSLGPTLNHRVGGSSPSPPTYVGKPEFEGFHIKNKKG